MFTINKHNFNKTFYSPQALPNATTTSGSDMLNISGTSTRFTKCYNHLRIRYAQHQPALPNDTTTSRSDINNIIRNINPLYQMLQPLQCQICSTSSRTSTRFTKCYNHFRIQICSNSSRTSTRFTKCYNHLRIRYVQHHAEHVMPENVMY